MNWKSWVLDALDNALGTVIGGLVLALVAALVLKSAARQNRRNLECLRRRSFRVAIAAAAYTAAAVLVASQLWSHGLSSSTMPAWVYWPLAVIGTAPPYILGAYALWLLLRLTLTYTALTLAWGLRGQVVQHVDADRPIGERGARTSPSSSTTASGPPSTEPPSGV